MTKNPSKDYRSFEEQHKNRGLQRERCTRLVSRSRSKDRADRMALKKNRIPRSQITRAEPRRKGSLQSQGSVPESKVSGGES